MEGIVRGITELARGLVEDLGAFGIFLGVMLETLVTLIPSPLVPMVAGFFLIPRGSDLGSVLSYSASVIGFIGGSAATLGALLHYFIGFYGGRAILERYGKYLGVEEDEIEEFSSRLSSKNNMFYLFLMRFLPVFPLSVVSLGSGLLGIRLLPYSLVTFAGCFLRYTTLGVLGFFVGEAYEEASHWIDSVENLLIILLIIGSAIYLLHRRLRRGGDRN